MTRYDTSGYVGKGDPIAYWTNTGVHFGFPSCCIEAFLRGDLPNESVFDGTGYRPCHKCIKLQPSVLIDWINLHRKHPDPFPNSDSFAEKYKEKMYD